ncbi:MAG: radical SAM protein, partial [Campylobacterales bacterium]
MLIDSFGRKITYLRVSVTERCNFRCRYCMPEKPFSWVPKENLLTYEELFMFIKAAIDEGITKIRLTGGEPTLREGLDELITMITNYAPTIDLAMTTNGYLLEDLAARFAKAGLKRINISLDSLRPETAAKIAQKDVLPKVLAGIEAAIKAGMSVKVNMVPLKGINDDEILDILNFGRERGLEVRFIEYMANTHAKEAT